MGQEKISSGIIVGCSKWNRSEYFDNSIYNYPLSYIIRFEYECISGVVENIVSLETNKVYYNYDVITGCGDQNSKVKIGVKLIRNDFTINDEVLYFNPHDIYLCSFDNDIHRYETYISNIKRIKSMSRNRDKKIKRILKIN